MPKLDLLSAHQFWRHYEDPMIYRVISFMETVETFTMDGNPALEQAVDKLGTSLDEITNFDFNCFSYILSKLRKMSNYYEIYFKFREINKI